MAEDRPAEQFPAIGQAGFTPRRKARKGRKASPFTSRPRLKGSLEVCVELEHLYGSPSLARTGDDQQNVPAPDTACRHVADHLPS